MLQNKQRRSVGWMGLQRGHRAKPGEWLAERLIFLVSLSAILMIFLIFLFIGREALPVALGKINSARVQEVIPVAQMESMSPAELQQYLELTPQQYEQMDRETLRTLMEIQVEIAGKVSDNKDARMNTASWRSLLLPYQWEGYSKPEFIWQPVSEIHKYNIVPLIIGSLKVTLVALVFAVPFSLMAAIYVSQLARPRVREVIKPVIELLAGIPWGSLASSSWRPSCSGSSGPSPG
jgi:phosphate transport system permease protein